MKAEEVLAVIVKRWPQEQCPKCKIVFTLSPLDEPSGVKAKDILQQELDRHEQQSHMPDFPSDWKAENQTQ